MLLGSVNGSVEKRLWPGKYHRPQAIDSSTLKHEPSKHAEQIRLIHYKNCNLLISQCTLRIVTLGCIERLEGRRIVSN